MTLNEYLKKYGIKPANFAHRHGFNKMTVWRWTKGYRIPTKACMEKIFCKTNGEVTPNDFYDLGDKT